MGSKGTDPDSLSVNRAAPPQKPPLRKGKLLSMHSDCRAPLNYVHVLELESWYVCGWSFPGVGSKGTVSDQDSLFVNPVAPPWKPPLRTGKLLSMYYDCNAPHVLQLES